MPDITTIQPYVTIIKDIFTGFAALVAAIIAIRGYDAWKKQLTANAERELARRVLVAVYKVRDAIEGCRMPAWVGDSEIVDVNKRIHEQRFAELDDANASLDVELLEAEAVWGDDEYYHLCISMFAALQQVLKDAYWIYYIPDPLVAPNVKEKNEAFLVLFTTGGGYPPDEFSSKIREAVKRIEDLLRPKLTLKQVKRKKTQWWNGWWHRLTKQRDWRV